jgi:tripartite-type tricarboxylate transporter receptor subunit TctC
MPIARRQLLQTASAATVLCAAGIRPAWAQKIDVVRVVCGFAPGGTADIVSRRVADKLHPGYANSAVVENRTGAGGQIAVSYVKNAAPDGTTVLLTPMSMLGIYPHTYKKLPYDPVADLEPVSVAAIFDYALAVGPAVPADVKTVPQFLTWCKANPSKANFGSPAAGSSPHFIGVLLGRAGGVEMTHVAFRGTQPAIVDLLGGQIAMVCGPVGEFTQYVKAGKCRLLATTGAKRSIFTPEAPTLVEEGYKDFSFNEWFGFFLPAKTPKDIVDRLNAAVRIALAAPDVIEGLHASGLEPTPTSPAELAAMLKADTARWGPLVKSVGFTAEG